MTGRDSLRLNLLRRLALGAGAVALAGLAGSGLVFAQTMPGPQPTAPPSAAAPPAAAPTAPAAPAAPANGQSAGPAAPGDASAPPEQTAPPLITPPPPVLAPEVVEPEPEETPPPKKEEAKKPEPEPLRRPRENVAIFQALDKITAETLRFQVQIGKPVRYKNLVFTVRACERTASDEAVEDSVAYVVIESQPKTAPGKPTPPARQAFRGWMYASSPGLHPLEHPIYDAWLITCRAA